MDFAIAVLSCFALAALAPWLCSLAGRWSGWLLAILPAGLVAYFGASAPAIFAGHMRRVEYAWIPSLGLNFSLWLDGLGLLFALLISAIGLLVLVYAGGYLQGHPHLGRLFAYLLMFMGSMLGLVLADNLLLLFVFWELTSFTSYLLVGFDHERAEARAAALQALLVTGGGGLGLLAGLLLLGAMADSWELSAILLQATGLTEHVLYVPALVLILLGAFTKSAQFPFHFWLPGAMEAPTPVSAYLHSATMVKAGVYLLARLSPVLAGTDLWFWTLTIIGSITMLLGGWLAVLQSDAKRLLAYSTVSALGTLVLLLGLGGSLAVYAAMAYLVGHALYKGALFLVAGILDHEAGTRDLDQLGGLWKVLPVTAFSAVVAGLSMAGLPPLFGFVAKELLYEAFLHADARMWFSTLAVVANMLLVAAAAVIGLRPFVGRKVRAPSPPHEAPPALWLGPLALATVSIAAVIWPTVAADPLLASASEAVLGGPVKMYLALWHGLTLALALSGVTLAGGIAVFAARGWLRAAARHTQFLGNWGPARGYQLALRAVNGLAAGQTRLLQSGYLRYYLAIILITAVALVVAALPGRERALVAAELTRWSNLRFYEAGLCALIVLSALASVLARTRLAAIAALGVVGFSVALVFVLFGAPDVAMTQFLVETLMVILFVLVFYHLPESRVVSSAALRLRDAALAVAVGGLMTGFALIGSRLKYHPPISDYFLEKSLPEAHGRNVVNVILVDFRGLDTLGEISVLAAAGVGVYALLKLRPAGDDQIAVRLMDRVDADRTVDGDSDVHPDGAAATAPPKEEAGR